MNIKERIKKIIRSFIIPQNDNNIKKLDTNIDNYLQILYN